MKHCWQRTRVIRTEVYGRGWGKTKHIEREGLFEYQCKQCGVTMQCKQSGKLKLEDWYKPGCDIDLDCSVQAIKMVQDS